MSTPSFPGGNGAMIELIKKNIHYPKEAKKDKIQGTVVVSFMVEKDGSVSNIKVFQGVHPLLDKEAVRVIGLMPKWKPGMKNDTPIRSICHVPIQFKLNESNPEEVSIQQGSVNQ